MATKRTTAASRAKATAPPTAPGAHVPRLAVGTNSPASRTRLILPAPRAMWTYLASPWDMGVVNGAFRPHLKKAWHKPGSCGNALNHAHGQGHVQYLQDFGYIAIPHDIECVAWGQPRRGEWSNYLERHEQRDPSGSRVLFEYHEHAWLLPQPTPVGLKWQADPEGLADFFARVIAFVAPDGLTDEQKANAASPAIDGARSLMDRDDTRARRNFVIQARHIPAEMMPPDVKARLDEVSSLT